MDASKSLYVAADKIHAREVDGIFDRLRDGSALVLLGIYYFLPWVTWDDRQAVLFDLPARKFFIFGLTFWPQDFFYMAWLLIIAAISLFFFTALAGRLWCGYACPQTVWTLAFVRLERLFEGNRSRRIKLDKAPWTVEKFLRKGGKQLSWILLGLWTGFIFVGYFTPVRELAQNVMSFSISGWEAFWIVFYGFATYGNAGIMREQVCKYMCPYARFQSAMFDRDSLIISYDRSRGEPRGSRSRDTDRNETPLGDCIDCTLCVQACPTGIDIRNGLQYECIACAACIDACDGVMDKMGYPRGLIRYTTENALEGKQTRVLRPRIIIYGSLLLVLLVGLATSLLNRQELRVDVLRDRNALYRELTDNRVENVYTVKIINKSERTHELAISADGLPDLRVVTEPERISIPAGELVSVSARVQADPGIAGAGGHDIRILVQSTIAPEIVAETESRYFLPANEPRGD